MKVKLLILKTNSEVVSGKCRQKLLLAAFSQFKSSFVARLEKMKRLGAKLREVLPKVTNQLLLRNYLDVMRSVLNFRCGQAEAAAKFADRKVKMVVYVEWLN